MAHELNEDEQIIANELQRQTEEASSAAPDIFDDNYKA